MEENVNNQQKNSSNKAIIIVLVLIVIGLLGFIVYDKFIQKDLKPETNTQEKECNCQKCENNSSSLGESISSVKEIELTEANQTFKVGNKELLLKINNSKLYVNNHIAKRAADDIEVLIRHAYITDKFVFFTDIGNSDESIVYAINVNGDEITVNESKYLMHDFKVVDGYLHAAGYVFCGIDCPTTGEDLLIKYNDNTLSVVSFK